MMEYNFMVTFFSNYYFFLNFAVPKSQPIAYAQLAFYLHQLGDTDAVTATIEVLFILSFLNIL